MSGPRSGQKSNVNFLAKAKAAWGETMPDWVEELAREASATSATLAAKKIGYSPSLLSHVLANSYIGDLQRVEEKVRGALMGKTVQCPILGEIGRDHCLDEQKKPFSATSSLRSKLYRACRAGCSHSRIFKEGA